MVEIKKNMTKRELRMFAGLWMPLGFGVIGALLFWKFKVAWGYDLANIAIGVWASAALLSIAGLIYTPIAKCVYLLLMYITFPIGFVVSHVILASVFFLVVTPIGLICRLVGYDPMHRKWSSDLKTYWHDRPEQKKPSSYFKQY